MRLVTGAVHPQVTVAFTPYHVRRLTPELDARNVKSFDVAIGRHPSTTIPGLVELLHADAPLESRDEAPVIRDGWL